jgi:hypothetical protein
VAVVLTPVQTKQIRKIYINGTIPRIQYKQYKTIITSTYIAKTPKYYKTI